MQQNKIVKIIAIVLLFGQLALMPGLAFAAANTALGSLNPIPINDTGSIAGNTGFDIPFTLQKSIYTTSCLPPIKAFEKVDNGARLGFSFSSLIGGGGAYAAQLQAEIVAYDAYLTCMLPVALAVDQLTAPNTYTSVIKQQFVTTLKSELQIYQSKLKVAQERFNVASQNIWKALLLTVLIQTSKTVANQLVNRLVNNYKIANIKQYADSLATLAYDNQYIRENFPDAQGQLMARAILTNPILRSQIQPGIYERARASLGFDTVALNFDDPSYYARAASVGFAKNNPYYLQAVFTSGVEVSRASALSSAREQISQGAGYKAPVTCAGSLAQQYSVDNQARFLSDQMNNRKVLLKQLQDAQALGKNVDQGDLAKAQSDYDKAYTAWANAPDAVPGKNPTVAICEAISSPAILINQGIDTMFKAMGANMSQYNSNNLPGFLSAISGIATQLGSSMVLGGITGHSSTIDERIAVEQAITATTGAVVQTINNNKANDLAKGIDFNAEQNSSVTNGYTLSWTIDTEKIKSARTVSITGNGITGVRANLPLSGSLSIVTTTGGNYLISVNDSSGKVLSSATVTITPQQAYNNVAAPSVAGAFTSKTHVSLRGPAEIVHLRGK